MVQAAGQGHAEAQYNLGVMYYEGQGVRQDYHKAVEWFCKAANQGFAQAQNNLGVMYDEGQGVRQKYSNRHKFYYGQACDHGLQKAVIIIDYFISRAISTDAYPVCPKSSKERDSDEKSTSPQLAI